MAQSDQGLLAIFWDIENCCVPRGKSAVSVAHCIRERFLHSNLKEAEFLCVCDVSKEPASLLSELNDAQVTVVHVSGEHKNAADDKLKHCMRKFCDSHKPPVTLVLISADTDFAADLSHMRNHHNYDIILVHNKPTVKQALAITAHKICRFEEVVENAPEKELLNGRGGDLEVHLVHISGLPMNVEMSKVKARLYTLVQNTKGTVLQCGRKDALVKYSKAAHAERAAKRLNQQDIYFCKITCTYLTNPDVSTFIGQSSLNTSLNASFGSPACHLNTSMPPGCSTSTPLAKGAARSYEQTLRPLSASVPHQPTRWPNNTPGQENPKAIDLTTNHNPRQTGVGNFTFNFSTNSRPPTMRSARMSLFQEEATPKHPRWTDCGTMDNLYRSGKQITVADLFKKADKIEKKETIAHNREEIAEQTRLGRPASVVGRPIDAVKSCEAGSAYCLAHCSPSEYTLIEERGMLPYVKVELKSLSSQLHQLLTQHGGKMHLMSFTLCYKSEFSELVSTSDGGVPLEHLISCVVGVHIQLVDGVKMISLRRPLSSASSMGGMSSASGNTQGQGPSGDVVDNQLSQFSQEVEELLMHKPNRQMSFSMFIPSYHHHFGRRCRPADFGFTKLKELLGAIPRVLQVLGTGNQSVLYLTREIHLKSFTSDLCRVLKAQTGEQCTVEDFPQKYSEVVGAELRMSNYGVCYIQDILSSVPASTVFVLELDGTTLMCIPRQHKHDKTPANVSKIEQFEYEVVDLLKSQLQRTMTFTKFIPAYHQHFGRQCRVADFGLSKLIDLFRAIPETVTVKENEEGRYISLTKIEHLKVFSEHILKLLNNSPFNSVMVKDFASLYQTMFGCELPLEEFGVTSVGQLLGKISHIAYVTKKGMQDFVQLINWSEVECLARRCFDILLLRTNGLVAVPVFIERYRDIFRESVDFMKLKQYLYPAVIVSLGDRPGRISLHPLLVIARRMMLLLSNHHGKLSVTDFDVAYKRAFGVSLVNSQSGYPCLEVLLQIMEFMVSLTGRGENQTILLRQNHIACLAHQLAYKVGIYWELLKRNDLNGHLSSETDRSFTSERISGDERVWANSADIYANKAFTGSPNTAISSANASLLYGGSSQSNISSTGLSKNGLRDLTQARVALDNLKLSPHDKLYL